MTIEETATFTEIDILENGTKIGFAEVSGEELVQFKIYEPFQGQGFGSMALEQILQKYDIKKINVMAENQKAIHLYEKHGFYINDLNMFEMRNAYDT